MRIPLRPIAALSTAALLLTGCAGAGATASGDEGTRLVVAIVSNPQMQDAISLQSRFTEANPGIDVDFVSLPENEARAKITTSIATGGGEFDVVMISNYETKQWAEFGWLENLQPRIDATEGYDDEDFMPSIREDLSYEGDMYSVPFYGESSFVAYRKDLFEQAGVEMPADPTWDEIAALAAELDGVEPGVAGICLRGLAGWGEVLSPFNSVLNTFGGRWYDQEWNARLDSPEFREAAEFYVDLVRKHGQPGAANSGFGDCLNRYSQGQTAMFYDSTAMVSTTENPDASTVVGESGYVAAPVAESDYGGWLYTWSLGVPASSPHKEEAWRFVSWMTDKDYIRTVGETYGWERVPPGSRRSTFEIPEYAEAAEAYAEPMRRGIEEADPRNPTLQPVPYTGIGFLAIPEFQDLGTRVSQQLSAAIAGQISVEEALEQSQRYAQSVGDTYKEESR
ncbi:sorbitol/mannitol transport system substrate-binding protein [Spinactinospora alkalitolerans]|uniref:Sorbitol/mannitol transport system substrate-binding protein n=1 Tax=Spinactinospora alkalitolerans TaxID=687207 RepID=A0A852U0P2_9ACTN|nr:sugar ABC transporter substrate-binding protein [Spinactinospora alkalitolerans]NYE47764.1 sorbitol/mannitol transport system substrate-binding protein [Spinactinospora alkalitolerans]